VSEQIQTHLQVPCALCGVLTDLPAVWTCPCGVYTTCQRSGCMQRVPREHRDGRCQPPDAQARAGLD
jgi:hypothetical protein